MMTQLTLMAAIALLTAIGIGGEVLADPPSKAGRPEFTVSMPFVNVGDPDLALCADANEDDQCDNAVAFITKTGHWGIRIPGVESGDAEPFRVCMTYWDPDPYDPGFRALLLSEDLYLIGPNNVLSAGGSLYADIQGYLDVVRLPGFAVQRWDGSYPTGCWGHLNEFETGIRID